MDHCIWLPYTQMQTASRPLKVVRSQNEFLYTEAGDKLIDAISSWWTACHGYNHPQIVDAIQLQAKQMPHVMLGGIIHPQAERLCHRLADCLPGDLNHVFLANTGSESVEIAMKMALQRGIHQGKTSQQFIHFRYGYHGDTLYAMSVCDPEEGMHQLFGDTLPQQRLFDIPTHEAAFEHFNHILTTQKNHIAGVIIEPLVQGAGGMKMHQASHLQKIASLCQSADIPLIVDEIFTGFGRTGTFFAIEAADIIPDIICLSKALTGGTLPLAAVVTRNQIYEAFLSSDPNRALMHGPTFMGNALACAAANASLDIFEQDQWQQQVNRISTQLNHGLAKLKKHAVVKDVRVMGAIGVVELVAPIADKHPWVVKQFLEAGIFLRPFGDILYTTPCFNISEKSLEIIIKAIQEVVGQWPTQ